MDCRARRPLDQLSVVTRARLGDANAHWLTDQLAVGGELNAFDEELADEQLRSLVAAGITHVVDLRAPREVMSTWPESSRFEVRRAGTHDDGSTKPDGWFASFVPWALAALDDRSHRLLVHCAMGSNRGPSGAFAILLMLGWTPDDALRSIQTQRPYAQIQYAEACLWVHAVTAAPLTQRSEDYAAITRWRTHSRAR